MDWTRAFSSYLWQQSTNAKKVTSSLETGKYMVGITVETKALSKLSKFVKWSLDDKSFDMI